MGVNRRHTPPPPSDPSTLTIIFLFRLQPLLTEIKNDRKTVAMGVLDYINAETLEYRYNDGYMTRYGFDWRMVFFETFFRPDQIGKTEADTRPLVLLTPLQSSAISGHFY